MNAYLALYAAMNTTYSIGSSPHLAPLVDMRSVLGHMASLFQTRTTATSFLEYFIKAYSE